MAAREILPEARARLLLGWHHSGFDVHHGRRIQPADKAHLEHIAQYIIRNPFSQDKMEFGESLPFREGRAATACPEPGRRAGRAAWSGPPRADARVIYHGKPNPRHARDREFFDPVDFIAAITQHIPEQGAQMVRYYGWYSNKSRGMGLTGSDLETRV